MDSGTPSGSPVSSLVGSEVWTSAESCEGVLLAVDCWRSGSAGALVSGSEDDCSVPSDGVEAEDMSFLAVLMLRSAEGGTSPWSGGEVHKSSHGGGLCKGLEVCGKHWGIECE